MPYKAIKWVSGAFSCYFGSFASEVRYPPLDLPPCRRRIKLTQTEDCLRHLFHLPGAAHGTTTIQATLPFFEEEHSANVGAVLFMGKSRDDR